MVDGRPTPARITTGRLLGALLACGLSGCALIHEEPKALPEIQPEQIRLADDIHLARDGWPAARWWTSYRDPQLDALINQALNDAPSMAIARSKVDEARARVELAQSATGLQAMLIGLVDWMHVSEGGLLGPFSTSISALGTTGPWYTGGVVGIGGGYQFDIWGKEQARINAAIGLQNAQLAEQAAVELEISTAVAQLYYEIQTTLHTVDLLQQTHAIVAATVAAHAARASRGLESETFTEQARAQQLAIERQLSSAQTAIRQLREGLRALVGAHADNLPDIAQAPLPTLQAGLPATLSYELLARRPDLQAMRWYVQASVAQIDAAKAAFYPSFDIKVFFGLTSLHLDDLFRSGNAQFNLIPGLRLPIFDGGRLNANLKGVSAASNTAIARYNQGVLNAVRDVAVTGARLQGLDEEARLQTDKVRAITFIQNSAEARYERGLASEITARKARLPVITEKIVLVGIRGNQLSQEITLVKALGGGYHADQLAAASSPVAPAKTSSR